MSTSTGTTSAEKKSFANADETRTFEKGTIDVVNLGNTQIGMAHFQPGWKWSECVKPIAQTDSCQAEHLGYFVSGSMHVVTDDGIEIDYGPGDAMYLAPGHDAWILGDDECVFVDFLGAKNYARR